MSNPTDKASVALLPCPICGCDEAHYCIGQHSFADVKIMCGNCCLESPLFDSHGDLEPAKAMNQADALAYWNRRALSPAQGDGMRDEHALNTLQIIADYPITDRAGNQDAANMALIASQALRALASHPDRQPGMTDEQSISIATKEYERDPYRHPIEIAAAAIKRASQRQ